MCLTCNPDSYCREKSPLSLSILLVFLHPPNDFQPRNRGANSNGCGLRVWYPRPALALQWSTLEAGAGGCGSRLQQSAEIPSVQTSPPYEELSSFCSKTTHKALWNRPDPSRVTIHPHACHNPSDILPHFVLPLTQTKPSRKATAEQCSCLIRHGTDGGRCHRSQATPGVQTATPSLTVV